MNSLLYGFSIFVTAFLLHIILWKIHLPRKNQTVVLLEIFTGCLLAGIFFGIRFFSLRIPELCIFYFSLLLAYITTYSAIEVDSPSLSMVLQIVKAGSSGLDKQEFYRSMTDDILVVSRLQDLVKDKMVVKVKDSYRLTFKGEFLASVFIFFRKLLNAPKGG